MDDRPFSGPFKLNTRGQQSSSRFGSATRLLDIGSLVQERQKSESNLSMARRLKTKNENEISKLVFFKRTKSETSATSVNDTYMMVNIFTFTFEKRASLGSLADVEKFIWVKIFLTIEEIWASISE
ncbi:hypothetical protein ACTXT7_006593 [Hymenolepis weldensis]